MALTAETIKEQKALEGLSAEQIAAIATLSANDENKVIGEKTKEIHSRYDEDIKRITGKDKPAGVHTYDNLNRILEDYVQAAKKVPAELTKQLDELRSERDELAKKIKDNAPEATKAEIAKMEGLLNDANSRIKALQEGEKSLKEEYEGKLKKASSDVTDLQVEYEFEKALQGVKFKDEKIIPLKVRETMIEKGKESIRMRYTPDFVQPEGKKRVMVFRDKEGAVVNNPQNLQNPYTAKEMLFEEIKDILDEGHQQPGGGTAGGGGGQGGGSGAIQVSGAKTQVEADRQIRKELATRGLAAGSKEFQEELTKAWELNKVATLPMKVTQ